MRPTQTVCCLTEKSYNLEEAKVEDVWYLNLLWSGGKPKAMKLSRHMRLLPEDISQETKVIIENINLSRQ